MRNKRVILILSILALALGAILIIQKICQAERSFPEKRHKIRIGCSSLTPLHCMFGEVFIRTDILKKHNLYGKITFFRHGEEQGKACENNKIDSTFSCEVPAIIHLVKFPDLRIIGTPGSLGRIALIVPEKSNIFAVGDLKNNKILVHSGSSADMAIHEWLFDSGLDPKRDVKLRHLNIDKIIELLSNGK